MPSKYPSEVRERIYALWAEGVGPTEIRRRLAANEAELGYPVEIPESSFYAIRRSLQQRRGKPANEIPQGQEISTLDALTRRSLSLLNREITRIEARESRTGQLSKQDGETLVRYLRAAPSIKKDLTREREPEPKTANASRKGRTQSLLAQLRETENGKGEGDSTAAEQQGMQASQTREHSAMATSSTPTT